MKKIIFTLLVVMVSLTAVAQSDNSSLVIRNGNSYVADGVVMDKKAFMGFLQSRDAVCYNAFHSAYRLSNVGWGLFGGGLVMQTIAIPIFFMNTTEATNVGRGLTVVGDMATTAGIVCLAIGYSRMHNVTNSYNAVQMQRSQPAVALTLQSSRDGIGLALRF